MSNIIIPEQSVIRAITENKGELAFDGTGVKVKPIAMKELADDVKKAEKQERNFRFLLPVGNGWRYYKTKPQGQDRWYVGWVKDRRIPKNSLPINEKTAVAMMYGIEVTEANEAKDNWGKISQDKQGFVNVSLAEKDGREYANMNDPITQEKVLQTHKTIRNV